MREIHINIKRGHFVVKVDDADYDELSKFHWNVTLDGKYVCRREFIRGSITPQCKYGKKKFVLMHRQILGLTDPKMHVDHIDHDPMNNQRSNLRVCTCSQNTKNKSSFKGSSSKYLGVFHYKDKYWRAQICSKSLGHFKTEDDAALAYNKAAIERYGEFANLNKIKEVA
jgi:hypothetical protein